MTGIEAKMLTTQDQIQSLHLLLCAVRLVVKPPTTSPLFRHTRLASVRPRRGWDEHANMFLVVCVFRVLARGDVLSESRSCLEDEHQTGGANSRPAIQRVGRVAAPQIQYKPDDLFCEIVGMSAVCPHTSDNKTSFHVRGDGALS